MSSVNVLIAITVALLAYFATYFFKDNDLDDIRE